MVHLVIGPVGSGKSTLAERLAHEHGAVRLTLDDWMAQLYGDDERPADRMAWYLARVDRCLGLIEALTVRLAEVDTPVALEVGLIRRADRRAFYERADVAGLDLTVHWVDAPRDVRRERVVRRNVDRGATFHTEVPLPFFEMASDLWEPPDDAEIAERGVKTLSADDQPPIGAVR